MSRARARVRYAVASGTMVAGILLSCCTNALALDPALDVSQYAHTSWKIRDGFTKGPINAIAQTPDGYLWLGTEFGLVRFDGVRTVPWQPPANQHLPSTNINSLLVARDGTLWIGTLKGLASFKDGTLAQYEELAGQGIFKLLEDREGTVWVGGTGIPSGKLCSIHNGSIKCYGEDGSLGVGALGLYEDSMGTLWVGGQYGLWRWKPGPPKFYPLPGEQNGIRGLGEDDGGALLVGWKGGIHRFNGGKTEAYSLPGIQGEFSAKRFLRDRDGGLWIGTQDRGIVHMHQGRTDVYVPSNGLSGENVFTLFEDREGNIWVATINGLDRFREYAVATFGADKGVSSVVGAVLAARDGSVWLAAAGGLGRLSNGQIMPFGSDGKLNGHNPHSLFQDDRGRIWVSTFGGFGYLENGRFISISNDPASNILSIGEDNAGDLWAISETFGLFHVLRGGGVQKTPWAGLGHKDHSSALTTDPLRGGIWLGFHLGGVAYFSDGQIRSSYSAADGLGEGRVNHLRLDRDGALWVSTDGGLSRLKDGHITTLTSKNGLPCDSVQWSIEDDDHSLWLRAACGVMCVARTDLDTWVTTVDKDKDAKPPIRLTLLDSSDGARILSSGTHNSPAVVKTSDGKLWFAGIEGAKLLDPRRRPFNKLPPSVCIEQITADRRIYDAGDMNGRLRLPPLIRDLQVDYTALSLVVPEKILFRYMLEGRDHDWQDAGNRRQAFYTDLPPGDYRFRVMACNNSGVWNEAGAFLDFTVDPAYYQTTWFRLACVAAVLLLLAALYQFRLRQVAKQFNMRIEERVAERTRIARELHDTLLQSFQGLLLKFQAVTFLYPEHPAEAQKKLESVIGEAEQAITEGRDAVQGLRLSSVTQNDLAQDISVLGEELAANQSNRNSHQFSVSQEGTPRTLVPLIHDEVHRIAGEALRNAFGHAQAKRIEVEIHYDRRRFRLRVRDNGKGINPKVLDRGGRDGHYGLSGMRERAELVGGTLEIWSEVDSGTEVELTIPGSVAYAKSPAPSRAPSKRSF